MNYPISSQESTREEGGVGVEVQKLQRFNEIFFISSLNSNSTQRSWLNILDHRRYGNGLSVFAICLQSVSGPLTSSRRPQCVSFLCALLFYLLNFRRKTNVTFECFYQIISRAKGYTMGWACSRTSMAGSGRASPFTTQNEWMTKEHSQRTTYYHKA